MRHLLLASVASFITAFHNDVCETVMVKIKGGSKDAVRVNKSDFDADQAEGGEGLYTLDKGETKAAKEEVAPASVATPIAPAPGVAVPPAPSAPDFRPPETVDTGAAPDPLVTPPADGGPVPPTHPSPNQKLLKQEGKKWFVVDATGTKITDVDGIDEAGYKTEQAGWDAILKLPH